MTIFILLLVHVMAITPIRIFARIVFGDGFVAGVNINFNVLLYNFVLCKDEIAKNNIFFDV